MTQPIVREHPQRTISRLQRQVDQLRRQATERPIERFEGEAVAALNQLREVVASLASEVIALRIENEGMRRAAAMPAGNQPSAHATSAPPDLLYGMRDIAQHLGITERQAMHLHSAGRLPTSKIGRAVCALRSKLDAWLQTNAGRAT